MATVDRNRNRGSMYGLILTAALAAANPIPAFAEEPHDFAIATPDATRAIHEFGTQSGIQILASAEQLEGKNLNKVTGTLSTDAGLRILLAGTGLTHRYVGERTVALVQADATPLPGGEREGPAKREGEGNSPPRSAETQNPSPKTGKGGDPQSGKGEGYESTSQELPAPAETGKAIPEVLVKGSRSTNADIRRTEDDTQPYVVFDRTQIDQSMATNVEGFLRTRLPMNTRQTPVNQNAGAQNGNQSQIDLRGLGVNQTLILVDGRRMPGVNQGSSMGQPDINGIPLAGIERIEVLPSTASGIYGGGATGGVINIITRKDYAGIDIGLTYGNAFETDVANRRVDMSAGFALEEGRTHLVVAASHADANALLTGDRDFAQRARARQFANNPSVFFNPATPPVGATSNFRNAGANQNTNLVLDPAFGGATLTSPRAFVPIGYAGAASDNGAGLIANAGQYNLDLPNSVNGAQQSLLDDPTVNSALLNVRRAFGDIVDSFVDVSWSENKGHVFTSSASFPTSVTLPANAPNNPFTTAVAVSYPAVGLSNQRDSDYETLRAGGGVIVRLPGDWTAGLDYTWSRSRYSTTNSRVLVGDPDGPTGPGGTYDAALTNGTLDVMRDLNAFPLDFSPYLLPTPGTVARDADTLLDDTNLRFSGPILSLPAGPAVLTGLIERREERTKDSLVDNITSATNPVRTYSLRPGVSQEVQSYYLEARVPLVSDTNPFSWVRNLELQVSGRRDEYETTLATPTSVAVSSPDAPRPTFTSATDDVEETSYTVGLRFTPVQHVTLRASLGTGFLPPSISQLIPSTPSPLTLSLTDPKRGGAPATIGPFTWSRGGRPDLVPEDSKSWSAGVVFTPRALPDFRMSIDYTHISKTNEINIPGNSDTERVQAMLDLEDFLPDRVTRAPLTPADQALGYTGGVVTGIDTSLMNIATTRVQSYDLQLDYIARTEALGDFHFYTVATWQQHFKRQAAAVLPTADLVGLSDGPIEWRGNIGLDWNRGPWSAGWNAQYYHSYFVYSSTANATTQATAILNQGSATIPDQAYHDLFARYRFDASPGLRSGVLANTDIMLGIQNVLDKEPPTLAIVDPGAQSYSTYGVPSLRRYTLTLEKRF